MPQKEKARAEEKLRIVEEYLSGKVGLTEAYMRVVVGRTTLQWWVSRYKTEGPTGFLPQGRNRSYSKETKLVAVLGLSCGKRKPTGNL